MIWWPIPSLRSCWAWMAVRLRSRVSWDPVLVAQGCWGVLISAFSTSFPDFVESSSGPGSHCSHRHPHAEPSPPPADLPKENDDDDEEGATTSTPAEPKGGGGLNHLPSRLDRLIAFLDSYFGQVELVRPEDVEESPSPAPAPAPPPVLVTAEEAVDPNPLEPAEKAEQELAEAAREQEGKELREKEELIKRPRVPVIRIRLDEHVADVVVESLVSRLGVLLTDARALRRADFLRRRRFARPSLLRMSHYNDESSRSFSWRSLSSPRSVEARPTSRPRMSKRPSGRNGQRRPRRRFPRRRRRRLRLCRVVVADMYVLYQRLVRRMSSELARTHLPRAIPLRKPLCLLHFRSILPLDYSDASIPPTRSPTTLPHYTTSCSSSSKVLHLPSVNASSPLHS